MSDKKKKLPTIVSPRLEVKYSHLVKPKEKYKKPGEYEFQLTCLIDKTNADHQKFMEQLTALSEAAKAEFVEKRPKVSKYALFVPFKNEEDKDGNETGNIVITFKNGAEFQYKGETIKTVIAIVDSQNKPFPNPKVGAGSIVRVAFQAIPFDNESSKSTGVSLRFTAVRIVKYVEFSSNAAAAFGGAEEGFEYEGGEDQFPAGTQEGTEKPKGDSSNGDF